ncbi:MAG: APC family permease [Deferribacterales bacterium]
MMDNKKIGTAKLCGLIVGPILGSGIIILPPISLNIMGEWAIYGWITIMCISFMFAHVFGKLSVMFPGDAGVSNAVEQAFGKGVKQLTSFYLAGAACFGPVAVLLTASDYANVSGTLNEHLLAAGFLILSMFLLLRRLTHIGTVSFILTSAAAVILFIGSASGLSDGGLSLSPTEPFSVQSFGYGLLLLFWTIVGWEIIGNFSNDIKDPERTMPRAIFISVLLIAGISLIVVAALQTRYPQQDISITLLLKPIFGGTAPYVTAFLTLSLCITTYLAFTGAVARLLNALSTDGKLPRWLKIRNTSNAPAAGIYVMISIHALALIMVSGGWLNVEKLVSIADGFFLANALTGILAGIKIFKSKREKWLSVFLAVLLCIILLFSNIYVIAVIIIMAFAIPKMVSADR